MPPEEFVYGKRNRTPTPVKQVINYDYGNNAKSALTNMYNQFISTSQNKTKLAPKSTRFFNNRLEKVREGKNTIEQKEPYKMKIFSQVESKVKAGLKKDKSYSQFQKGEHSENIDRLIHNIENELKGNNY